MTGRAKQKFARPALRNLEFSERTEEMGVGDVEEAVPVALMNENEGPSYLRFEAWVEVK